MKCWIDYPEEGLFYRLKYSLLLYISLYIFGFSFVVWRWFFFTLLSHTLTSVSRFRFIDLDPAAVLVPVAFFFYILQNKSLISQINPCTSYWDENNFDMFYVLWLLICKRIANIYFGGCFIQRSLGFRWNIAMKQHVNITQLQCQHQSACFNEFIKII